MTESFCVCMNEPLRFSLYDIVKHLGTDKTNGRFGEVAVLQCKICGQTWLRYSVEYEAFQGSGRYFMGLITPEIADGLAPEQAVEYLNQLEWHLYGGSYFGSKGKSSGTVNPDI